MAIEKTGGTVQTEQLGIINNWKAEKRTGLESKSFEDAYKDGTKRFENAQKNKEKLRQYEQITSSTEKAKLQLFFETVFAQVNPHHLISSEPLTKEKMKEYMVQDFQTVYLFAVKQTGGRAINWPENQRPTDEMFSTIEQVFNVNYTPEERVALGNYIIGITKGKEAVTEIITWKDKNYEELIIELNKPENLRCEGAILAYVAQDLKEQGYIVEINASTGKPQIIHLPEMSPLNLPVEAQLTDPQLQKLAFLISNLGHSAEAVDPNYGSVEYFFDKAKVKFNFTKPDGSEISWEELWITNTLPASDPTNVKRVENKNHILSNIAAQKAELLKTINTPSDQIGSHLTDEAQLWYQRLTIIEANLNNPQSIDTVAMNEINDQIKTQDILDQAGIKAGIREENATDRIMKLVQSPELLTPAILIAIAGFFFGKNSPFFQKLKYGSWLIIGANVLGPAAKELYDIIGDEIKTNDAIEKGRYTAESASSAGAENLNEKISNLTTDHPNGLEERFAGSYTKMKSDFDKTPGLDAKYSKTDVQKAFLLLSYDQKFLSTSPDSLKNKNNYEMYYDKSIFEKNGLTNPDLMTTIINLIITNQGLGSSYTTMDGLLSQGTPKDIESGIDKNYLSMSSKYDDFDRAVYSELSTLSGYPLKSVSEMSLSIEASPRAKVESILKDGKLEIKEDVLWFDTDTDKLKNVANELERINGLSPIEQEKVNKIAAIYRDEYYRMNIQQKGENYLKLAEKAANVHVGERTIDSTWNSFVNFLSESSSQNTIDFESWKIIESDVDTLNHIKDKAQEVKKEIQNMPGGESPIVQKEKEKWLSAIDEIIPKLERTTSEIKHHDAMDELKDISLVNASALKTEKINQVSELMIENPELMSEKINQVNKNLENLSNPQSDLFAYSVLLSSNESSLKELMIYAKAYFQNETAPAGVTRPNIDLFKKYTENVQDYLTTQKSRILPNADREAFIPKDGKTKVEQQIWLEAQYNTLENVENKIFINDILVGSENLFNTITGGPIQKQDTSYYEVIDKIYNDLLGSRDVSLLSYVKSIHTEIQKREAALNEQEKEWALKNTEIRLSIEPDSLKTSNANDVNKVISEIKENHSRIIEEENDAIRNRRIEELQNKVDKYVLKFTNDNSSTIVTQETENIVKNFDDFKNDISALNRINIDSSAFDKIVRNKNELAEEGEILERKSSTILENAPEVEEPLQEIISKIAVFSKISENIELTLFSGEEFDTSKSVQYYIDTIETFKGFNSPGMWGVNETNDTIRINIQPENRENYELVIEPNQSIPTEHFDDFQKYMDKEIDKSIDKINKAFN